MISLLHKKEFHQLLNSQKKKLREIGNKTNRRFRIECEKEIEAFLLSQQLPLSLVESIYSSIINEEFDFPLDVGISLKVGDDEITLNEPQEILIIKDIKTGKTSPGDISIVITAKTSIDRLIKFIEENRKEIEHWQEVIGLPIYKRLTWKHINLALHVIEMKDEKNMTFGQIADTFLKNETLSADDQDYYGDEDNMKTIYYRFKKRLLK